MKAYGRAALTALAYAMNDEFSRVLSQQMDYYSNNPNADSINRMRGEIDQVFYCLVLSGSFCSWLLTYAVRLQLKNITCRGWTVSALPFQVRSVMLDNIDRVLERGDRLELLVDKTATMEGNTMRFKRQARRFRNTMWWRNVKLTYVISLALLSAHFSGSSMPFYL